MPKIVSKDPAAACLTKAFISLSDEDRRALEGLALVLHYGPDELVAQEGSYFSGVYNICQGLVAIGKYAPKTQERRVLRFLAPGEWYGLEPFFLGREPVNLQFARTIVDSTLLFFDTARFRAFLEHHPRALVDLCRWFGREVAMLEFKLTRETTESSDRNFALILLALGNKYGDTQPTGITVLQLPLTRQALAELMGISVETLMRLLRRFRERGLINTSRATIEILSKERLEEVARTPDFYLSIIEETL
jgi:CRP-like cAMP-binding protein